MNSTLKSILIAIAIVLLVLLLWYIRAVLTYVLVAAVLSIVGRPIMHFFESRRIGKFKIPSSLSALLTLACEILVIVGFFSLFVPLIMEEARLISNMDPAVAKESLKEPIADLENWMDDKNLIPEDQTKKEFMNENINKLFGYIDITGMFTAIIGQLGNVVIGLFSIFFITFFFLKDRYLLYKIIYAITPDKDQDKMRQVLQNAKVTLRRYFIGILLQISIITILAWIGLSLLGIKNALLIGFLAGIINIIPYLGPIIGGLIGVLIGITSHLHLDFYTEMVPLILKILSVFAVIQLIDNFVSQPFIYSSSVKAHPLEIFIVILIAGTLAGIPGMIMAVPFYSFMRILAREFFSQFRFVQTMTRSMDR